MDTGRYLRYVRGFVSLLAQRGHSLGLADFYIRRRMRISEPPSRIVAPVLAIAALERSSKLVFLHCCSLSLSREREGKPPARRVSQIAPAARIVACWRIDRFPEIPRYAAGFADATTRRGTHAFSYAKYVLAGGWIAIRSLPLMSPVKVMLGWGGRERKRERYGEIPKRVRLRAAHKAHICQRKGQKMTKRGTLKCVQSAQEFASVDLRYAECGLEILQSNDWVTIDIEKKNSCKRNADELTWKNKEGKKEGYLYTYMYIYNRNIVTRNND